MEPIISLISASPYFQWPAGLEGWAGMLALTGLVVGLLYRWRDRHPARTSRHIVLLALLAALVPVTSLFGGLRLPIGQALPPPGVPIEPKGPAWMVFSAVPWVLAGGILGPGPAAALAAFSGALVGFWDTHNPLLVLEWALVAVLASAAIRQRYRTLFFRLLRHPLPALTLLTLFYPLLHVVGAVLSIQGGFAVRLDFALAGVFWTSVAMGGQLLVAGLVAEGVAYAWPASWGLQGPLQPSPMESSLQTRFQYTLGALIVLLVIGLMVGDWWVAGNAARGMLQQRLGDTARMGAESIPFFLETGQNLILQIASDPALLETPGEELPDLLAQHLRATPYFRQLYLLDENGEPLNGYPRTDFNLLFPTPEEQQGIALARQGVAFQYYTVPPAEFEFENAAQVSFIAAVRDAQGQVGGVLLGRTDLATNPFTKPVLNSLAGLSAIGGEGMLLDEEGRILYHPLPNLVMTSYTRELSDEPLFFSDTAADGTRSLVYQQPVVGREWAVVLTVSAQQAQQLALSIAAPLLGLLLLLSLTVFGLMRFGVRVISASLQGLAREADRIAAGDLDHPLEPGGEDEVGQLRRAFEEMRSRLKARLDELNQLLLVSQGVAASLEIEASVTPVLQSALTTGANAAYVVLAPEALPDLEEDRLPNFAAGEAADEFAHLNDQVLELMERQEQILLTNPTRARSVLAVEGRAVPESLLAVALRHESTYYGVLWLAHKAPHTFSQEEVQFITTLAGQSALAAANASLFLSAEIGRQRLEAILNSTPDPVLVTDRHNRLMMANPAARELLMEGLEPVAGLPLAQAIAQADVVALLESPDGGQASLEIAFPDDQYYYATASSVIADGKQVGRVCVLQDITRFKQLDTLKSEFVDSVSHDLRSPLTLVRGYATMLQMVGALNDQQTSYVRKILSGVESMNRLVTNLLDLGRIEAGIGLKIEMVPVVDILERVTGALQLQADQKHLNLEVEIPEHTTKIIEADQALLQQAVYNLVENAVKYTPSGGTITIRVSERNQKLVIEVRDTGIGIAPVDQPRLFERFYRAARREARQQRGSGLGLAIVKSIAERHGGRVWVESQLGKGSQFFLEIPIEQPEASQQRHATQDVV